MPTPTYTITCLRKELIAADVYDVWFDTPEGFSFRGGQFVLFDIPLIDTPEDIQPRAFSVASAPTEKDLRFAIKLLPGGRASRWVEEVLKEGDQIIMKGPFGFFLLDQSPRDVAFIATSTGIAPFRSQLLEALAAGDKRRMDIVYGVRSEEDLFWKEELESLSRKHPNVHLHIALSSPSPAWTGHRGRVQIVAPQVIQDLAACTLYVCGNPEMTKEVKQIALTEWGMMKEQLHVEGYI